MGSAVGLAAIAVIIDHTRHRLPEPEPAQEQSAQEAAAPCGLGESPCGLAESPCGLGTAPCGLGESPCGLEGTPCGLGESPCSLNEPESPCSL